MVPLGNSKNRSVAYFRHTMDCTRNALFRNNSDVGIIVFPLSDLLRGILDSRLTATHLSAHTHTTPNTMCRVGSACMFQGGCRRQISWCYVFRGARCVVTCVVLRTVLWPFSSSPKTKFATACASAQTTCACVCYTLDSAVYAVDYKEQHAQTFRTAHISTRLHRVIWPHARTRAWPSSGKLAGILETNFKLIRIKVVYSFGQCTTATSHNATCAWFREHIFVCRHFDVLCDSFTCLEVLRWSQSTKNLNRMQRYL